jgi:hypothetical protein
VLSQDILHIAVLRSVLREKRTSGIL